jgi:hypothetical protein
VRRGTISLRGAWCEVTYLLFTIVIHTAAPAAGCECSAISLVLVPESVRMPCFARDPPVIRAMHSSVAGRTQDLSGCARLSWGMPQLAIQGLCEHYVCLAVPFSLAVLVVGKVIDRRRDDGGSQRLFDAPGFFEHGGCILVLMVLAAGAH